MEPFKTIRLSYLDELENDPEVQKILGPDLTGEFHRIATPHEAFQIINRLIGYKMSIRLSYMTTPQQLRNIEQVNLHDNPPQCEVVYERGYAGSKSIYLKQEAMDAEFLTIEVDDSKKEVIIKFKKIKDEKHGI